MFLLSHLLRRFVRSGTLTVIAPDGKSHRFGGTPGPVVAIRLHDRSLSRKVFFRPEMAVGEAYMDGTLTFEEGCTVHDFFHLFGVNRKSLGAYPLQSALRWLSRQFRALQQYNPAARSLRNVAHHYDLSRQLYELFLDRDLQYSCAYYENPGDTLEQAQENKKRHLSAKLCLKADQKVLDIGSGWGGLAMHLARNAGVDVTGVTLSQEQLRLATERTRSQGLDERVRFLLKDYREVTGPFDRIVSVGMLEHVGVRYFDKFFGKVRDLLTEDGVAVIHAIGKMSPPSSAGPWLRKYIFPGAYTPALSEVLAAVEKQGLWVTDIEILRLHYAETLKEWARRFQANRSRVAELYDERFCRMWEFYLAACEAVFRHGSGIVFQLQLTRRRDIVPLTRDYITTGREQSTHRLAS